MQLYCVFHNLTLNSFTLSTRRASQIFFRTDCAALIEAGVTRPALREWTASGELTAFGVEAALCTPTTCSTESSSVPNKFWVDPLGSASLLAEVLEGEPLSGLLAPPPWTPFLWPWCEDSEDIALPMAVGIVSTDMEISYWR
jgi:hypothetical protein